MTKRRNRPPAATAAAPAPPPPAVPARRIREIDVLAGAMAVICVIFAFLSAGALNPDGVSYLDLAQAAQHGDWSHFVQGYWSPLLPFVTGAIGAIGGLDGTRLIAVIHVLNLVATLGGLAIIWHWARRLPTPWFGRFAVAMVGLCNGGLPRIEAVTPDVLLLTIMICLSYELLAHHGRRWLLVGVLLGAAFLVKTSSWPWLIIGLPLRLWSAGDPEARRSTWRSTLIGAAIMLTWIVPMSIKYGHPTVGSSGRLNYSWYIHANSSRMPDTDRGENLAYRTVPVGNGRLVTVATFDDAAHWTYQPWGDPTAWEAKVVTQTGHLPTPLQIGGYWLRLTGLIFGLWLGPLIAVVLLPAWLLFRRPGMVREALVSDRDTLMVIGLGLLGVLQFAVVHAEPRLIAPYAAMLTLGWINWCVAPPSARISIRAPAIRLGLSWIGVVAVLGFAVFRLREGAQSYSRLVGVERQLDNLKRQLVASGNPNVTRGIVGPAAPFLASAYWIGARIVMQVPPSSANLIATLPTADQATMLASLFRGKVVMVWQTSANGGMRMLLVPPAQ